MPLPVTATLTLAPPALRTAVPVVPGSSPATVSSAVAASAALRTPSGEPPTARVAVGAASAVVSMTIWNGWLAGPALPAASMAVAVKA